MTASSEHRYTIARVRSVLARIADPTPTPLAGRLGAVRGTGLRRLGIHEAGDGWEPLCAFLGKPVPDQPYPSRNSASEFPGIPAAGR